MQRLIRTLAALLVAGAIFLWDGLQSEAQQMNIQNPVLVFTSEVGTSFEYLSSAARNQMGANGPYDMVAASLNLVATCKDNTRHLAGQQVQFTTSHPNFISFVQVYSPTDSNGKA